MFLFGSATTRARTLTRRLPALLLAAGLAVATPWGATHAQPASTGEPKPVSDVLPLQGTWALKGAPDKKLILEQNGASLKGRFEVGGTACFTMEGTATRNGADLSVFYTRPTGPPCATSPLDQDVWDEVVKAKGDPAHAGAAKTSWRLSCGPKDVELSGDREELVVPWDRDRATGKVTLKDPHTGATLAVQPVPQTLSGPLAINHIAPPEDSP